MDPSNIEKQDLPEEPRFLDFPHLPADAADKDGKQRLNKYSSTITKDHDFPGAQVGRFGFFTEASNTGMQIDADLTQAMLYAAGVPDREAMQNSAQVGVASVWWEGNPCKYDVPGVSLVSTC